MQGAHSFVGNLDGAPKLTMSCYDTLTEPKCQRPGDRSTLTADTAPETSCKPDTVLKNRQIKRAATTSLRSEEKRIVPGCIREALRQCCHSGRRREQDPPSKPNILPRGRANKEHCERPRTLRLPQPQPEHSCADAQQGNATKLPTVPQKRAHHAAPLQLLTSTTHYLQTPTECLTLPRRQARSTGVCTGHRAAHPLTCLQQCHQPSPSPSPRGSCAF